MSDTRNLWKHPKSGLWYVRRMKDGKRKLFPTGTSSILEAREARDAFFTDIRRGKLGFETEKSKVTLKELVEKYLAWSESHHKGHQNYVGYCDEFIKSFGEDVHIDKITTWDIEKFLKSKKNKLSPATRNRYLSCLKHMYRLANEDWDLCTHDPTRKVKKLREENERERFLTDDERSRLLKACDSGPWYMTPIVKIATNTGMRRGEILNLLWSHVDIQNGNIRVTKSKSGKPRDIPMNVTVKEMFRELPRNEDRIFPIDGFKTAWYTVLKRAKVHNLKFHDLRHDAGSWLAMSGADPRTIQEILGHSDLKMVMRYTHLSESHKRNAVEQLANIHNRASEDTGKVIAFPTK
jgi:integrase